MISKEAYLILQWVLLVGFSIIGLVSVLNNKTKYQNNSFSYICLSLSVHLLFNISLITGFISKFTILIPLDQINGHLFAVVLFYHLTDVTKLKIRHRVLIISVFVGAFISVYYYYLFLNLPLANQSLFLKNLSQFKPERLFLVPILFIQLTDIVSLFYMGRLSYIFKQKSSNFLSSNYHKSYIYIVFIFMISVSLLVLSLLFILLLPQEFAQFLMIPLVYYLFFFISYMVYSGIPIYEFQQNSEMVNKLGYLPDDTMQDNDIEIRMRSLIERNELYKNPNLSLFDLARLVSIGSHTLSQYINQTLNTNFSGYINNFRIIEAKSLLHNSEYDNLTLDAIAEMCGFRNRITFYRVFKKSEGISPSEYKSSQKKL